MIKENQKLLNRLQVVLDGLVIIASYVLAWYIRFKTGIFEQDPWALSLGYYMQLLIGIVPGFLLLYYVFHLYAPKRVLGGSLAHYTGQCTWSHGSDPSVVSGQTV